MPETTRATVLTPGQVKHLLAVTEVTSRHPERDALVLLLGLSCGLRITETAQVTIGDLLLPNGKLRKEVSLRAPPIRFVKMDSDKSSETGHSPANDLSI